MKIFRVLFFPLIFWVLMLSSFTNQVEAQAGRVYACQWDSTQARVQADENDPWKSTLYLGCEDSFNIGSFHNGTGEFAKDTNLAVTYPNGRVRNLSWWTSNGKRIKVYENGTYILKVDTKYRYGSACEDAAKVIVDCDSRDYDPPESTSKPYPKPSVTPTPKPSDDPVDKSCSYANTQARVQESIKHPWQENINIGCFDRFNVGSFHDGTGQFADDTKLKVVADISLPWQERVTLEKFYNNGDAVFPVFPGRYTLEVTTSGQYGEMCEDKAISHVECGKWFDFMSGWRRVD